MMHRNANIRGIRGEAGLDFGYGETSRTQRDVVRGTSLRTSSARSANSALKTMWLVSVILNIVKRGVIKYI